MDLVEALTHLVAKLEEIEANEAFKGIFGFALIHGCRYDGPYWTNELANAKKVLSLQYVKGSQSEKINSV